MKKKLVLTAAVIAALSVGSCDSKKTNNKEADQDSLSYTEKDSLESNAFVLDSIAGTYEGTLPAADCPRYQDRAHTQCRQYIPVLSRLSRAQGWSRRSKWHLQDAG